MIVKLLGMQALDFTSADGNKIVGNNLFIAFEQKNVNGFKTDKVFCSDKISLPKELKTNTLLNISFNMHGKVESVEVHT